MEQLVELRKRLVVLVVAIVIGMGIAWNFSPALVRFVERPLTGQTYLADLKKEVYREVRERYPAIYQRYQLDRDASPSVKERQLNYSAPLEPFFIQCKISMLAGFILVLPVLFYQVWGFVAPRLGRRERRLVLPFVTLGSLSFCTGAFFFLTVVWPVIINFSISYEAQGLQSWFNLSDYINFCLRLILVFGLIFELPVISMLLARLGLVTHGFLAGNRRYALLASAVVAAFHADLLTMFVIMVPLYTMYEVSVWVALLFGRKRIVNAY
jgi:sec-independent protein translocase protein TatC